MSINDRWNGLGDWLKGGIFGVLFGISYAAILEGVSKPLAELFFLPLFPASLFFYVFFEEKGIWFLSILNFGLLGAVFGYLHNQLKISKKPFWTLGWVTLPLAVIGILILIPSYLIYVYYIPQFIVVIISLTLAFFVLYLGFSKIVIARLSLRSLVVFVPFLVIALIMHVSSSDVGISREINTVSSVPYDKLFPDKVTSNNCDRDFLYNQENQVFLQTITVKNNLFFSRSRKTPSYMACFYPPISVESGVQVFYYMDEIYYTWRKPFKIPANSEKTIVVKVALYCRTYEENIDTRSFTEILLLEGAPNCYFYSEEQKNKAIRIKIEK